MLFPGFLRSFASANAAMSLSAMTVGVLGRKLMAVFTMGFVALYCCAYCADAHSPADIFFMSDWFKMPRVHATTDAAEMVQFQPIRYRTDELFIRDDMCSTSAPLYLGPGITILIQCEQPNPAPSLSDWHAASVNLFLYVIIEFGHCDLLGRSRWATGGRHPLVARPRISRLTNKINNMHESKIVHIASRKDMLSKLTSERRIGS
jgi:hypothetical protein